MRVVQVMRMQTKQQTEGERERFLRLCSRRYHARGAGNENANEATNRGREGEVSFTGVPECELAI
jgi:hypothetical protein